MTGLADLVTFTVPGEPVAFARAGSNGKRRFTPPAQAAFMQTVALYARRAMAGRPPFSGPVELSITAVFEPPASWPAAKKATTLWKTSKADATNLGKLPEDAMNGIVWLDDAQVAILVVQKIYGPQAALFVSVRALHEGGYGRENLDGSADKKSQAVAA